MKVTLENKLSACLCKLAKLMYRQVGNQISTAINFCHLPTVLFRWSIFVHFALVNGFFFISKANICYQKLEDTFCFVQLKCNTVLAKKDEMATVLIFLLLAFQVCGNGIYYLCRHRQQDEFRSYLMFSNGSSLVKMHRNVNQV